MSFLEDLEKLEKTEQGGGGYIGQVTLEFGYKAYVKGVTNAESWFPFKVGDKASMEAAHKRGVDYYSENGITAETDEKKIKNMRPACLMRLHKDTVLNREVMWKEDRFWISALWTSAYKDVIAPKLREAGIEGTGDYWVRVGFIADPSGREEPDQEGKMQPSLVPFIAKKFVDRAEALKEAKGGDTSTSETAPADNKPTVAVPNGWQEKAWIAAIADIKAAVSGGQPKSEVAADYAISVQDVNNDLAM